MSALKHGFFRRGFMLCDRCVLNGRCESFVPGGECDVEKKTYDRVFSELMEQYWLEGLADEIMVGRVAMYLIRIARAEVYEANVGVSDKSVAWGKYVTGLDNTLRALLKELALTRTARKKLEENDVLVDFDRLLKVVKKKSDVKKKMFRVHSPMNLLFEDWKMTKQTFTSVSQGDNDAEEEKDS